MKSTFALVALTLAMLAARRDPTMRPPGASSRPTALYAIKDGAG